MTTHRLYLYNILYLCHNNPNVIMILHTSIYILRIHSQSFHDWTQLLWGVDVLQVASWTKDMHPHYNIYGSIIWKEKESARGRQWRLQPYMLANRLVHTLMIHYILMEIDHCVHCNKHDTCAAISICWLLCHHQHCQHCQQLYEGLLHTQVHSCWYIRYNWKVSSYKMKCDYW